MNGGLGKKKVQKHIGRHTTQLGLRNGDISDSAQKMSPKRSVSEGDVLVHSLYSLT